jgi:predicted RNA binding protein YcfA (HicA-like mRNA interferase family)
MKRGTLLRHLRRHGCVLKREGRSHSLWMNPRTGGTEAVPRHTEIPDNLARKICRGLSIPEIGRAGGSGRA